MNRLKLICFKRIVIGFAASCLAVIVTTWALRTYVPNSTPFLFAGGAAFATFYCMSFALRTATREAYHAGEIGRRLPARRVRKSIDAERGRPDKRLAARSVFSAGADHSEPKTDESRVVVAVADDD